MSDNRTAVTEGPAFEAAMAQIDRAFGINAAERRPLPSTMTERVARELAAIAVRAEGLSYEELGQRVDSDWRNYIEDARSVFGVMYQPTAEMLDDVEGSQDRDEYQDLLTAREQIEHIWQVMLTTAEYELDPDELARKERLAEADRKWREAGCPDQGGECPF